MSCVYLVFESQYIQNKHGPNNKLLTNLHLLESYWGILVLVVFVQTSLCLVHPATTSGQYSTERHSRLVSVRSRYRIMVAGLTVFGNRALTLRL